MCPRRGTFFSCLAKKRRQKKATPLPAAPARSAGATCGARCWRGLARTRACGAQTIASPDPLSPALLGAARRGLKPTRAFAALGRVWGAERSEGTNRSPPSIWLRRGAQGAGWRVCRRTHTLRCLARRGCPSGARQRAASSTAHPVTAHRRLPEAKRRDAGCGAPFFWVLFFGEVYGPETYETGVPGHSKHMATLPHEV